jgi:hypothetical protein
LVQVFELDASVWKTTDDFYEALFAAIGAPDWHGRSGVALVDTMFHDDVNKVAPPYRVEVRHTANLPAEVRADLVAIVDLFERIRRRRSKRGEYVEVSILLDSDLRGYKVVAVGAYLFNGTVPAAFKSMQSRPVLQRRAMTKTSSWMRVAPFPTLKMGCCFTVGREHLANT